MSGEGCGLSQTVSQGEICILKLRSDNSSVSDYMLDTAYTLTHEFH